MSGVPAPFRYWLELSGTEMKEVRFILRQMTTLWNCLIMHVGDEVVKIINEEPCDEKSSDMIRSLITDAYKVIINGEYPELGFSPSQYWEQRIKYIQRAPSEVRVNRVEDLISSYNYAHKRRSSGTSYPYIPGIKKYGSTETVRFPSMHWFSEGDRVTLNIGKTITFKVEGMANAPTGPCSLTLTKKQPARARKGIPTNGASKSPFYITLNSDS